VFSALAPPEQPAGLLRWYPATPSITREQSAVPERQGDHIVETPTEARAAVTGHQVRYVLILSTLGVVVLFAGIYVYFFA
jgi:hypothetical protein